MNSEPESGTCDFSSDGDREFMAQQLLFIIKQKEKDLRSLEEGVSGELTKKSEDELKRHAESM